MSEKKSSLVRVFFGIPIPENIYLDLKNSVFKKNPKIPDTIPWVPSENCHLTLRFIGNISEPLVSSLIEIAMIEIIQTTKFQINIEKIDHFPNGRSSLIAAYVYNSHPLKNLFKRLDDAIVAANFPKESREYKPHITLFRNKTVPPFHILPVDMENYPLSITEVILYQSLMQKGGSIYKPLQRFLMKD